MKLRYCNKCKKPIEGIFVKCCKSEMIDKKTHNTQTIISIQRLTYLGDLHPECWKEVAK